jgi:hypothetical protein
VYNFEDWVGGFKQEKYRNPKWDFQLLELCTGSQGVGLTFDFLVRNCREGSEQDTSLGCMDFQEIGWKYFPRVEPVTDTGRSTDRGKEAFSEV